MGLMMVNVCRVGGVIMFYTYRHLIFQETARMIAKVFKIILNRCRQVVVSIPKTPYQTYIIYFLNTHKMLSYSYTQDIILDNSHKIIEQRILLEH